MEVEAAQSTLPSGDAVNEEEEEEEEEEAEMMLPWEPHRRWLGRELVWEDEGVSRSRWSRKAQVTRSTSVGLVEVDRKGMPATGR